VPAGALVHERALLPRLEQTEVFGLAEVSPAERSFDDEQAVPGRRIVGERHRYTIQGARDRSRELGATLSGRLVDDRDHFGCAKEEAHANRNWDSSSAAERIT